MSQPLASRIRALRALGLAAALCAFAAASLAQQSPFAPPPKPEPRFVRLLAFADYFDPDVLADFERVTGKQIAYDVYDAPDSIAAKMREAPYDVVVLPGPALREAIAAGSLQKIDRTRLTNFSAVSPRVEAKLSSYDPSGVYGIAYMWFATGLLLDADKATARLGAQPISWGVLFSPDLARRFADCGAATPDDRDDLFMAAWRHMGVNPARLTPLDIRRAGDLLLRVKAGARAFLAPDMVGALATGSVCVGIGREADAARAIERAKQGGLNLIVRFVVPREGAPMSLDAFAIPKDAQHVGDAYALLDYLLRPDVAARNAHITGAASGDQAGDEELFKQLSPSAAISPTLQALVDKEWTRVKTGEAAPAQKRPTRRR